MTDTDALVNLFDTEFESTHAMQHKARRAYVRISGFLADLRQNAEQLDRLPNHPGWRAPAGATDAGRDQRHREAR